MTAQGPSFGELVTIAVLTGVAVWGIRVSARHFEPTMCERALADPMKAEPLTLRDCQVEQELRRKASHG
jgi:hypothetical protein